MPQKNILKRNPVSETGKLDAGFQKWAMKGISKVDELFKEECLTNRLNDEHYRG